MSHRQRQRRRKRHRGKSSRAAFLVLGVLSTTAAIGILAVVGWIIGIMASAPDLSTIKPVEQGASSVVYASDGERLGFIQADTLRTPVPREGIPINVRNATVGGQEAVGVQAAARMFFGKPASRLSLTEAALLAGLPQAPSDYNPFLH